MNGRIGEVEEVLVVIQSSYGRSFLGGCLHLSRRCFPEEYLWKSYFQLMDRPLLQRFLSRLPNRVNRRRSGLVDGPAVASPPNGSINKASVVLGFISLKPFVHHLIIEILAHS
jgi:hypothetical protein